MSRISPCMLQYENCDEKMGEKAPGENPANTKTIHTEKILMEM